ncbi:MAG: hypothetical protein J7500_09630 [Sphingomonas sp.]|uniref:hypothetical protein n=1 Tax=Sphingomonas sp. TaxID=28214 RepID=UPI001B1C7DA5|nr:hypothetical protein [Sphingomonas sp.]MBO9622958.1 hypothetical protein [Sphingomonas sp.]
MWLVIALGLASAAAPSGQGVTAKGTAFGPRQRLVCDWFTNFENSRLGHCKVGGRTVPGFEDGASIECAGRACEQLDAEARKVAGWKQREPVTGTFTVEFHGRVGPRREPRYLGDGHRTVLIERLVKVEKR